MKAVKIGAKTFNLAYENVGSRYKFALHNTENDRLYMFKDDILFKDISQKRAKYVVETVLKTASIKRIQNLLGYKNVASVKSFINKIK